MSEKVRKSLTAVVITAVTSPATIKRLAAEHELNPQEVFVRVNFKYEGKEYSSSNQLRFFGEAGYQRLLDAKQSGEPVDITLTANEKGTLLYLDSAEKVEVNDLFSVPLERVDNRAKIEDLFYMPRSSGLLL